MDNRRTVNQREKSTTTRPDHLTQLLAYRRRPNSTNENIVLLDFIGRYVTEHRELQFLILHLGQTHIAIEVSLESPFFPIPQ